MEKLFSRSDALVFSRDTVDTSTLGDKVPSFTRTAFIVHACPGINVEDILSEVQDIEDKIEMELLTTGLDSTILTTTLSEHDDMVIALTYKAFSYLAIGNHKGLLLRNRYKAFAEELVHLRDERFKNLKQPN